MATRDDDLELVQRWASGEEEPRPLEGYAYWGPPSPFNVRCDTEGPPRGISAAAAAYIESLEQRTPEWLRVRRAEFTGSEIAKKIGLGFCTRAKGSYVTMREEFSVDTEETTRTWVDSEAARYGTENETLAREMYAWFFDTEVATTNLVVCRDPGMGHIAASPDGLVDDDGLVEIKISMKTAYRQIPSYYIVQVMTQLRVTRRKWCDFVMLYLPPDEDYETHDTSKMTVIRVHYSPEYWQVVEDTVNRYAAAVHGHRTGHDCVKLPLALRHGGMPTLTKETSQVIESPMSKYANLVEYSLDE